MTLSPPLEHCVSVETELWMAIIDGAARLKDENRRRPRLDRMSASQAEFAQQPLPLGVFAELKRHMCALLFAGNYFLFEGDPKRTRYNRCWSVAAGHVAWQSEPVQPDRDFFLRLRLPDKESHRQRISAENNLF